MILEVTADTRCTYLTQPSYDKQYENHLWTCMTSQVMLLTDLR